MKVALVTVPPSVPSAVGDHARRLAPYLAERCELEVFVPDALAGEELAGRPALPASALRPKGADRILYQVGNERALAFLVPLVRRLGGVVALHDWALPELARAAFPALERGGLRGFAVAVREGGIAEARRYARSLPGGLELNRSVVRFGDAFVVPSEWMRQRVLAERNAPTPTGLVPCGADRRPAGEERAAIRARLGLSCGELVVAVGATGDAERVAALVRGFLDATVGRPDARLVLAGAAPRELDARVTVTGPLDETALLAHLHAADVAVSLCGPGGGELAGLAACVLGAGRALIATRRPEQAALPEACALAVSTGEGEANALSSALDALLEDPARRAAMEAAALRFVDEECHWSRVAQRYAELLERFPAHRANRKSLVRTAIEQADRARAGREA